MSSPSGSDAVEPAGGPAQAMHPLPPSTPGQRLAAARQQERLSVAEVAGRLRIRPALVEAMERDDFAALGARPYQLGQIRNYARLLRLDEAILLAAMDARPAPAHVPVRRRALPRSGSAPRGLARLTAALVALVIVGLGVVWAYHQYAPNTYPIPEAPARTASPAPSYSGEGPQSLALPSLEGSTPAAGQQPGAAVAPGVPVPPQAAGVAIPGQPLATAAPVAPEKHLVLSFSAACWVEVSDATGARLVYRMARTGDRHEVSGKPPYAVMVGNASAVDISYNGAPVEKPADAKSILRLSVGG